MSRILSKRLPLILMMAALAGVAACGEVDEEQAPPPEVPTVPPQETPPDAGSSPDAGAPDAGTGPSALRGQEIFEQQCAVCHPGGQAGVGPSLITSTISVEQMRTQIRTGGNGMPPFPPFILPDSDLEDLIAYLLELRSQ